MDIFGNRFDITKGKPKAAGIEVQTVDVSGNCLTFLSAYNRLGTVIAPGQPVTIDSDHTYHRKAIANATTDSEVYKYTGVAKNHMPVAIGALAWFQIGGPAKALVDGTAAVVAGDALEVINAGTSFIKAASARDLATGAIAKAAQAEASAVLIDVELIPERHSIESA
jgi:hypothetical protein